ncbi:MAG: thiol peroxidase [Desulfovibrionales bacterium]
MRVRENRVTIHGKPLTLIGKEVGPGDKAPDFTALDNDLQEVGLGTFAGKILVLSSVPSLDTPTCDMETRRFNQETHSLGNAVQVLTLSMDLPFAQKRWCAAAGIDSVKTLSDHRDASFGKNYGVLVEELRLLARVVFVVDRDTVVRYREIVSELTEEPDYGQALSAVRALL